MQGRRGINNSFSRRASGEEIDLMVARCVRVGYATPLPFEFEQYGGFRVSGLCNDQAHWRQWSVAE